MKNQNTSHTSSPLIRPVYAKTAASSSPTTPIRGSHTAASDLQVSYTHTLAPQNLLNALLANHYTYLAGEMYKRAIHHTTESDAAHELVQKAFSRALERDRKAPWKPRSAKTLNDLSAYLCRIVDMLFLDEMRRKKRHQTISVPNLSPSWNSDHSMRTEHALSYNQAMSSLQTQFGTLHVRIMTLLTEGYTHAEIAENLHLTVSRVRQCIYHSRQILKEWLE
jgi:DNA-directed RNA polymerase specialized sigma24 family protein